MDITKQNLKSTCKRDLWDLDQDLYSFLGLHLLPDTMGMCIFIQTFCELRECELNVVNGVIWHDVIPGNRIKIPCSPSRYLCTFVGFGC